MRTLEDQTDASLGRGGTSTDAPAGEAPGVLAPPPLIYLGGLAIGFGLQALLPSTSLPNAVEWILGSLLIIAGVALAVSFIAVFRRAQTPVDPYRPTTTIVTTGPYRLSRNPGYLGMALAYAGIAVLTGALWVLLALIPTLILIDRVVIRREERYLESRFGEQYLRYKARARRWL
jgi:protein-S-isoprenylcysteine O-methyltransferase Ste14